MSENENIKEKIIGYLIVILVYIPLFYLFVELGFDPEIVIFYMILTLIPSSTFYTIWLLDPELTCLLRLAEIIANLLILIGEIATDN